MGRFRDALSQPDLGAIAEVKRRSPSAGDLRPDADPAELAAKHGLVQESDTGALLAVAEGVLDANPSVVSDFLGGKDKALTFLVGQLMKETKGRANPAVAQEVLREALGRRAAPR